MTNTTEIKKFLDAQIDVISLKGADADETENFKECIRSTLKASGVADNIEDIVSATDAENIDDTVSSIANDIGEGLRQVISEDAATMLSVVIAGVLSVTLTKFCATEVKKESC